MGQPCPQQHAQVLLQEPCERLPGRPEAGDPHMPADRDTGASGQDRPRRPRAGGLHQVSRSAGGRQQQEECLNNSCVGGGGVSAE